jgi:hypothetical protein
MATADKGFALAKLTTVDWTTVQFDTNNQRFYLPEEKKEAVFRTKGGIYAGKLCPPPQPPLSGPDPTYRSLIPVDEMGLGKTITMLALVLANPLDITRPPAVDDNHFVTKATLVLLEPPHKDSAGCINFFN